jgi:hypothetical protein
MNDTPNDMPTRVAVLEQIAKETRDALTDLRTEMRQGFADLRTEMRAVRRGPPPSVTPASTSPGERG